MKKQTADGMPRASSPKHQAKQTRRTSLSRQKGKIVTVDDIDGWQEFIMDFLEVIPGTSGEEFEVVKAFKVNVIITHIV